MSEKRHSSIGIHGLHAHNAAHGIHRLRLLGRMRRYAIVICSVLGIGVAVVIGLRIVQASALAEVSREQATLYVSVITPKAHADASADLLRLPATLQGFSEAPIYARTSGYVSHWYKDIGDRVKQGDILAQIDAPEVEQQLNEAKANLQLARATFERWDALQKRDAVSSQELEEKKNTLATATAAVKRLQEQVGFSHVTAPFAGVITRRNIDIGNLVDAGGGSHILFTLAKTDPLRVYVYVPQNYAARIKPGDKATITLTEMPGRSFDGRIVRTAGAIDTLTRTMQVEIALPNADGQLLPGAFAQVAINTKAMVAKPGAGANATNAANAETEQILMLPSNTLLFRPEGVRAAVVGDGGKVNLVPVSIAREFGNQVEVVGLKPSDKVILNPPDSLAEGDGVSVVADKPAAGDKKNKGGKDAKESGA